jgi:hypothetical protein
MQPRVLRWLLLVLFLCIVVACSLPDERIAADVHRATLPTPTFVPTTTAGMRRSPTLGDSTIGDTIRLEDPEWAGGFRSSRGSRVYGGRTAVWIYGSATDYSTMRAEFTLQGQPIGTAQLSIEGMDSEDDTKTPISVVINGAELYRGPNPLPNDDLPLDSGTWETFTWRFGAALLRPGPNLIEISNLAVGAFGQPPFFMLDYAEIVYEARP